MNIRKEITDVFTPRRSEVNDAMYVDRPQLQKALLRSFARNSHTLVYGESGNGKSWLYKKVLETNSIPYIVANCANASRIKSLTQEICSCIVEPGTITKMGFNEEKAAEISAVFAKGGLKHSGNYAISQEEPLLKAFRIFAASTSAKKIIVLDNLESIFNTPDLMNELADIIILLDDSRYADCNINFLIVGIPNGVLQYFRETKNSDSVANRIQEIRRVDSLHSGQVMEIVRKGFSQLKITVTGANLTEIANHVAEVTLGIAQRVHEYCESLAYEVSENGWRYDKKLLEKANQQWLLEGLRHSYQVMEGHLNSRETAVARRNQVIYCISRVRLHQFDSSEIDKLVREEFPSTVPNTNMGIGTILGELASGDTPFILRNQKTGAYVVRDPRYIMCARIILYKDPTHSKVCRRSFTI